MFRTRKFVSRKKPWVAELMQDKTIMKKIFLLFSLLLGVLSAWAYDVELDGIFYNLDKENKTASVASYSYKGAVVIPETISVDGKAYTVTSLGENCFSGCWGLTSITIPNSVTRIGEYCFSSCGGLESIVVESGNTVYDSRENCNAIIETATNTMLSGCRNTTIPNSVTSLGDGCFSGCSGLTSITIPSSVTSLGVCCFSGCSRLTSITIPNSVTSLGEYCFGECSRLTSITIPNSVTRLGNQCFYECSGLTSITIPNSVTSLGNGCFWFCSGLTSITIPNSVTRLGNQCFYECSGLTSITIPNSVTSLGNDCFGDCSGLTSITIPNSVTSLGGYCFDCCLGLTEVHANRETPPATGYDIFHTCISLQTIYVPTGASANYDIDPWNAYKIVEEGVQSGITAVTVKGETVAPVYHLNGSRAGTTKSFSTQPKGIYIVNGKKVLR